MASTNALTHIDAHGRARMVDVADKPLSARRARARAEVRTSPAVARLVLENATRKGDVVATMRLAGIMAAKRTSELVPLAHQVALSSVAVDVAIDAEEGSIEITTEARTAAGTGVEIEAMVAASIAAVTCYDMIKSVDRGASICETRVIEKHGGASGSFTLGADGELHPQAPE